MAIFTFSLSGIYSIMSYLGELSAVLTAFLWSGTSLAFSAAAERLGSFTLNLYRLILASVFLFLTIIIAGFEYTLSFSQIFFLAVSGIIGLVIGDQFLFNSYRHIGARLTMLLMALSPAMSAVLAFFFLGEGLTFWSITGMFITISGIALVVSERHEVPDSKYKISRIGIFHGLMAALGQAGGLILAKFAFQEGDINGFVATFVRIFTSVLIMVPLAFSLRRFQNPVKVYMKDHKAFYSTVTGTVFGPYLGITTSLIAVAHTKVGIASTLMSTMPIIMLPMLKYFYKEKLSWRAIAGAVITVSGVGILFLR
jgi:drug/metabolite transporter (DMT)-like permease